MTNSDQVSAHDVSEGPAAIYERRVGELEATIIEFRSRDLRFSRSRGVTFLMALGLIGGGIAWQSRFVIALGGIVFAAFIVLIVRHEQLQRRLFVAETRREVLRRQLARAKRNWSAMPGVTERPNDAIHEIEIEMPKVTLDAGTANDLDLFGHGSLWQLVNLAGTAFGQRVLHDWLLTSASPGELVQRQSAVKRLAPMVEFRENLTLNGCLLAATQADPTDFVRWAEGPQWLSERAWLKWATRILGGAMFLMIVAIAAQWVAVEWVVAAIGLLVINVGINTIWAGSIHDLFNRISAGKYDMLHYSALFQAVDELPGDVPKLAALKNQMRADDVSFHTALVKLQRIVRLSSGRKSRMFGVPWTFLQIFFFWDFHMLDWLERWQARFGSNVAKWFDALAQLEALSSLATLAHDQPDWCFATVSPELSTVTVGGMGHPLLPQSTCVRNDVSVGPAGSFLLVTGSNMSGKSTLLRSLGVNTVLGLCGGPVCATRFSLLPVELATSMRITDSLERGVSFFMAELERLKAIVDQARRLTSETGTMMFYLLDEILQGTNTAERHVAVTRVIGHLLACRTIGAVSTHDLELATTAELKDRCELVHFRETIELGRDGETMSFDYVLRDGVTPTTNALKLLEMVGLGEMPNNAGGRRPSRLPSPSHRPGSV